MHVWVSSLGCLVILVWVLVSLGCNQSENTALRPTRARSIDLEFSIEWSDSVTAQCLLVKTAIASAPRLTRITGLLSVPRSLKCWTFDRAAGAGRVIVAPRAALPDTVDY